MSTPINKTWYKEMSVYQIWPRSFCDGNGDGIGDLEGVISKLDYIKSLNVDAIWFSPLYTSPNADYGYDIADYRNISEDYGTLEQFKTLVDEAHRRGIKIIMDLVVNHTSDEHEWFKQGRADKNSPYHDYYYWRKGKKPGGKKPPNNWKSLFEGGAWEYDADLDEYYLHIFAKKQPDLNMSNPAVREEVKNIMRFWLDLGVDGFREDVITYIAKREGLPNGFPIPAAVGMEHYSGLPKVHDYLTEFRKEVLEPYGAFTVGEAPMMTPKKAKKYIEEGGNQVLDLMFHFQHMGADCIFTDWIVTPFSLKRMKKAFSRWQRGMYGTAWNALYLENHDHPRIINRYGDPLYRVESGKMLAAMYICQCGTPFVYQGQEIGMLNTERGSFDDFKDVMAHNMRKTFRSFGFSEKRILSIANKATRENARTPVQWSAAKNAGFTAGAPWVGVNPNYTEINVEAAENDADSLLHFYRALLKFRKENELVIYGDYKEHFKSSRNLYVYERNYKGRRLLVICSFTDKPVKLTAPKGFDLQKGELVFQNYKDVTAQGNTIVTKPYETRVYLFN
ncbi:MAG: alpha-glucosidase [Oscillospiraceae bacterium]|nr:alpha-glucosidase [Oscillospiraceae bacterium]